MRMMFRSEDPTAEPGRLTGLGVLAAVVGVVLAGVSGDLRGLGVVIGIIGGLLLYVGLTAWAVTIGLAAHSASETEDV